MSEGNCHICTGADLIVWPDEPSSEVQPDDELPLCQPYGDDEHWAIAGGADHGCIRVVSYYGSVWVAPGVLVTPLTPFARDLLAALVADDS